MAVKEKDQVDAEISTGKLNLAKAKEKDSPYRDYTGKKVTVRTIRAIDCNLCGKVFQFRNEMKEYEDGSKEKVGCEYTFDSKDFDVKNGKETVNVFSEVLHKLTRPQNKIVEIIGVE